MCTASALHAHHNGNVIRWSQKRDWEKEMRFCPRLHLDSAWHRRRFKSLACLTFFLSIVYCWKACHFRQWFYKTQILTTYVVRIGTEMFIVLLKKMKGKTLKTNRDCREKWLFFSYSNSNNNTLISEWFTSITNLEKESVNWLRQSGGFT